MATLNASLMPRCRRWSDQGDGEAEHLGDHQLARRGEEQAGAQDEVAHGEGVRLALPLDVDDQRLADREGGGPEHPRQGQGRGGSGQRADDDDEQRHRDRGHGGREQHDPLGNTQAGHACFLHLDTVRHRRHLLTTSSCRTRTSRTSSCRTRTSRTSSCRTSDMPDQRHAGPAHAGPATSRTSSCRTRTSRTSSCRTRTSRTSSCRSSSALVVFRPARPGRGRRRHLTADVDLTA